MQVFVKANVLGDTPECTSCSNSKLLLMYFYSSCVQNGVLHYFKTC